MHDFSQTAPRRAPSRGLKIAAGIGVAVALGIVVSGLLSRSAAHRSLTHVAMAQTIPTVSLVQVSAPASQTLTLPGSVQAFYNAAIHARVSGYLTHWYTDIGAPVRAGQVLAVIETPDLDQQLARAQADLSTAQANQQLSRTTSARWAGLLAQDAVSRQEADEKAGDLAARTSLVQAAKAQLDQYRAMESFKVIRAPFAGVVTARSTDVGALIAAGSPNDPGLFTVSDVHRLRIYVRVPQSYLSQIHPGMIASVTVPEYPGRVFQATLVTTSNAVGEQSGAMLLELQMDNPGGVLKPGEYAQVRFDLASSGGLASVPASATMFRKRGLSVAMIGPGDRVIIRPITVARDMGSTVEVGAGVKPGDRVIDNPPDSLTDGERVNLTPGPAVRMASAANP